MDYNNDNEIAKKCQLLWVQEYSVLCLL